MMAVNVPPMRTRMPLRAVLICIAALVVPVLVMVYNPDGLGRHEALLWMITLVPAFLLAYYRGWRGVTLALAAGMALLSTTHAITAGFGRPIQDWPMLLGSVAAYIGIALGIGWVSERLRRDRVLAERNAIDLLLLLDGGGRIRYASPSVERILGHAPSELTETTLVQCVHEEDAALIADLLVTNSRDARPVEFRIRHADGSWRTIDAVAERRFDDPLIEGLVIRGHDVTERRQIEEQLRRAGQARAVGRIAGGVAHGFNNVLTTIRGHAGLLLDELDRDPGMRASLEEIRRAVDRATALTYQLLAFSRQQVLQPQVLDLNEVVTDMKSSLENVLGDEIEVVSGLDRRVGPIRMDPAQVRQVLLTLASYARNVMPEGGRLTIHTLRAELDEHSARRYSYAVRAGRYTALIVSDTGPGMDEATRARVFEPFVAAVGDGTGLELSSVYGIIKQSGGYVWVDSEPGEGTTFRIYFPEVEPAAATTDVRSAAEDAPSAGVETVLLVEDDAQLRSLVRKVLMKQGYSVLEAENGLDALAVAAQAGRSIRVLVTDLKMPKMGGLEVAERLSSEFPGLRVLLMSGYTEQASLSESILRAEVGFLQKPFSPTDFTRAIRSISEPAAVA